MHRDELKYSDKQLIETVWEAYTIQIQNLTFVDSGSFFGFVAEQTDYHKLFMKVYPKSTMTASSLVSKDSLNDIGLALRRFRNEFGIKKLSFCIPDKNNNFCFETNQLMILKG